MMELLTWRNICCVLQVLLVLEDKSTKCEITNAFETLRDHLRMCFLTAGAPPLTLLNASKIMFKTFCMHIKLEWKWD